MIVNKKTIVYQCFLRELCVYNKMTLYAHMPMCSEMNSANCLTHKHTYTHTAHMPPHTSMTVSSPVMQTSLSVRNSTPITQKVPGFVIINFKFMTIKLNVWCFLYECLQELKTSILSKIY